MTETTEKQKEVEAIIQSLEDESDVFKRMARITKGLINYSKNLEAQVSSLTKERDRLKAEVDDLNYRAEEDERTIISHEKEMDALKSQLSNKEKEIEELKTHNAKLQEFFDYCVSHEDDIDICTLHGLAEGLFSHFSKKEEALASLQSKSKEGEEK